MRNILNINNYHYRRGGADAVYLDHGAMMVESAWKSAFFSMHHPHNLASPWSKYFIDELEYTEQKDFTQKIRMVGKMIYSFEAASKLRALLKEFRPDIAHLHNIYHHLSPSILRVLKQSGIPTVLTAHDLKLACPAYKMYNHSGICEKCRDGSVLNVVKNRCVKDSFSASAAVAIESTLHRSLQIYKNNIDRIIVPSMFYKQKLVEWGWVPEQIVYIPNYVDIEEFAPEFAAGDYYLYFGRLSSEKGLPTLVRAAVKAGVPLKLAGSGPDEQQLKRMAESLGGDIEFLGYCTGQSLHDLVRQARAVVLPSEWYENAPMSILESYALGKPVIGARIGGIPELIVDGVTGWSFESKNVAHLSERLSECASLDNAHISKCGVAGHEFVREKFGKRSYRNAILTLYDSVLHESVRRDERDIAIAP